MIDLRNLQEQVKEAFYLKNCNAIIVQINCFQKYKKKIKFSTFSLEFQKFYLNQ